MIKLPEEINHIIKTIEQAGYEAYAVGGCVRDTILGKHPEDWDLTSNASRPVLEALFPDAAIVNKKLGVMRISEGEITADLAVYRIDGEYKDYRRPETVIFTNEISEDLRRRDFTMNAIAVNPARGIVDPYRGMEDIERKLIRGIGDPKVRFEEDALRILRAIRFSAQLGFEIDRKTLDAMKEKSGLLAFISVERILEEFRKMILSQNSGKGIRLLMEAGVLPFILGKECAESASDAELAKLSLLAEKIDQTERDFKMRAALVFLCFEKGKAVKAVEHLCYSNEVKRLLQQAVIHMDEFTEIRGKEELKRFICRNGLAFFHFLVNVSKLLHIVYPLNDAELQQKILLFREIKENKEPVFLEDLAVNGNDLIKAGIGEGIVIGRILDRLLEAVHLEPETNSRNLLLELAQKIKEESYD